MLEHLRASLHSNLPHEFFTPLGGILGLAEVLRAEWAGLPPKEVTEMLGDLHHSSLRLHRTLRNYLTMLDLRATDDEARLPGPVDAQRLDQRIWSGIRAAARRHHRHADIHVQIDPCDVLAVPEDLSLMVEELVDNACQYSGVGTPIHVSFTAEGEFAVRDEGRGMTPEEMKSIGAFQQFDRQNEERQGLGLGLVLVNRLAAKCGTKPRLESDVGQGTTVSIAFLKAKSPG